MTEHIVAIFENDNSAGEAERELAASGLEASAVRRYSRESEAGRQAGEVAPAETATSHGGFWAWLLGEEGTETTRDAYASHEAHYDRRVDAGSTVLSVTVRDDSRIHQVVEILESHHPLEMDESTDESDTPGDELQTTTTGVGAGIATTRATMQSEDLPPVERSATNPAAAARSVPPSKTGSSGRAGAEEVIPLAEEQLEVGKRTVDRGTTRVRRYVVEKPVERDVTLHGERVTVERRRPTAASGTSGEGAFEERVVEVHESEEQPEVRKTARVTEEVAIRREETERHEKVRDTVRRDEVDITPDKANRRETPSR